MIYPDLNTKLQTLPQSALEEVAMYVDYVFYKFTTSEKQHMEEKKKRVWMLKRYTLQNVT